MSAVADDDPRRACRPARGPSAWPASPAGFLAVWLTLPPFEVRAQGAPVALAVVGLGCGAWALQAREWRAGGWAVAVAIAAVLISIWAQGRSTSTLGEVVNSGLFAATLVVRGAARLRRHRRRLLGALGRGQHRPRGDDADGRLLRHLGRRRGAARGSSGLLVAMIAGGAARGRPRDLHHPPARRPDRDRHRDELPRPGHHRVHVHRRLRRPGHARPTCRWCPTSACRASAASPGSRACSGS